MAILMKRSQIAAASAAVAVTAFLLAVNWNKVGQAANHQGPIFVYFGSQTGTAEGFARSMASFLEDGGKPAEVVDLENFDPKELADQSTMIFIMATYGDGEPTENAEKFWDWLHQSSSFALRNIFWGKRIAIMGLGHSTYPKYNVVAKKLHEILTSAGAIMITELCLGDDAEDIEADFNEWVAKVVPEILMSEAEGPGSTKRPIDDKPSLKRLSSLVDLGIDVSAKKPTIRQVAKKPSEFDLLISDSASILAETVPMPENVAGTSAQSSVYFQLYQCPVVSAKELRQKTVKAKGASTVEILVNSSEALEYWKYLANPEALVDKRQIQTELAATIDILPRNRTSDVDFFLMRLGILPYHVPRDNNSNHPSVFSYSDFIAAAPLASSRLQRDLITEFVPTLRPLRDISNSNDFYNYGTGKVQETSFVPVPFEEDEDGSEDVRRLCASEYITFIPRNIENRDNTRRPLPSPLTIRDTLSYFCELSQLPPRSTLQRLAGYCEMQADRASIRYLLSESGSELFKLATRTYCLTLAEYFEIFMSSARLHLANFLQILGSQKTRPYTSSSASKQGQFSLTVHTAVRDLPPLQGFFEELKKHDCNPSIFRGTQQTVIELSSRPRAFFGLCSWYLASEVFKGINHPQHDPSILELKQRRRLSRISNESLDSPDPGSPASAPYVL
eukprot:GHVP01005459.1.p1 GENE.GHVP01005459.1~~GHVP01005459.1.p1  ORF type:complete len:675 (+),score=116.93 GHVP01005459.1:29-2053(+)